MRPSYWIWVWWACAVLLATLAFVDPEVFSVVLCQPLEILWSSQEKLNATIIDVSSDPAIPLQEAGRRLLKPFERVRLIRRVPVPNPSDH